MAKPKFSILSLCTSVSWGESEFSTIRWAQLLTSRGHNITTVVPEDSPIGERLRRLELPQVTIPARGRFSPISSWLKLRSILRRRDIHLIHFHNPNDGKLLSPFQLSMGDLKIFFAWHGDSMVQSRLKILDRMLFSKLEAAIVASEFAKRKLIAAIGLDEAKVFVIHEGFDPRSYEFSQESKLQIRNQLEIPANHLVIGCRNWIGETMGQYELIEATRMIRRRLSNVHLIVIGEAERNGAAYLQALRKKICEYGMDQSVTFISSSFGTPQLFAAMDIFVHPVYEDVSGRYLIEAMLAGLACIGTDSGAVPEILEGGKVGLLVEPRSVQELARAIQNLMEKQALRNDLGKRARRFASDRFSEDRMVDGIENIHRRSLGV